MRLREELARVADTAPVAHVSADTWGRARRARTRDRVLAGAAVVAVLALVGGLGAVLPSRDSTPVAGSTAAALPNHIWLVPDRIAQQDVDLHFTGDVESDLAIGTQAVGYVTTTGVPVLVDAEDGDYHVLRLPGFNGRTASASDDRAGLALSPDGDLLAYPFVDPSARAGNAPMPSGIRIIDLEKGTVTTVPLTGGDGVMVRSIAWSPGGGWLVWSGQPTTSWTGASSFTAAGAVLAGRIRVGATTSQPVPASNDSKAQYAVSDAGEVAVVSTNRLTLWDGRRLPAPALSAQQRTTPVHAGWAAGRLRVVRTTGAQYSYRVYQEAGHHFLSVDPREWALDLTPLGWVAGDRLLARTAGPDSLASGFRSQLTLRTYARTFRRPVTVSEVDAGVPRITVAVDLADRPSVDRPEPDWPWSTDRIAWTIGLGVAGALALILAARALWRRTRHL